VRSERIARLQQECATRAQQPLPAGRARLIVGGEPCGWVEPRVARCLAQTPSCFELAGSGLRLLPESADFDQRSAALMQAALRLQAAGLLRHWRSEQLDVRGEDGSRLATIERAACRALGIATRSVHLNAFAADGTLMAAQRADHKPSDPGLWDNLAGGIVAAGETELEAMKREAIEEAGLVLEQARLRPGRIWQIQRPVAEGLMIERVQVFDVDLPADFSPVNGDGEVARFRAWPIDAVLDAIEQGRFALEASLATLDALARRESAGTRG